MKKLLTIVLLLITCTTLTFGQKLKKVKQSYDFPYKYKEIYHVLKNDKTVKHGKYERKHGKKLMQVGQYNNNEETGIWTVYNYNGELSYKYDFSADSLIYFSKEAVENYKYGEISTPPLLELGTTDLFVRLFKLVNYPVEARNLNIEGKVIMELSISEKGKISDINVLESNHELFSETGIKICQSIQKELKYLPATKDGLPIVSKVLLPLKFSLAKSRALF